MNGNTRTEKIQNEEICFKIGVAPIDKKMTESHLRWFGYVQRGEINVSVGMSKLREQREVDEI
jgi:hypothetical protein